MYILQLHISSFQCLIRFLKIEKVFNCSILCGKIWVRLFPRWARVSTPKDVGASLGIQLHFHLVLAARNIWAVPAVPFHLVIMEIILPLFDALTGKLGAYENNNFSV